MDSHSRAPKKNTSHGNEVLPQDTTHLIQRPCYHVAYSLEISGEKTNLMTNNTSDINTEIKVNGQKLETVTSFKYLGSIVTDEGSKPEILCRIAQTTAALTRLKPIWIDKEYFSQLQDTTDVLPSHIHLPVCL